MASPRRITLVPIAAGLHLRWPRYNAAVLTEVLRRGAPQALALEPLTPGFERDPSWRDHDEILLPWVAVPWARRAGVPVYGVHEPSPHPNAPSELERYLAGYPAARAALDEARAQEEPLADLLAAALTLPRLLEEVVPLLASLRSSLLAGFGDGPATDWSEERAAEAARRVLEIDAEHVMALVSLDRFVSLREALSAAGAPLALAAEPPPDDAARERALLDLAWRGEGAEAGALVAELRRLGHAEARYHAAGLLLANAHPVEALEELEQALRLEFAEPWYLPGSLLSRLGQLRDLLGRRTEALRAYRGVLALEWAPRAALEAAREGIERPFGADEASA